MTKITPTEEWQDAIRDHIQKLSEDEKRDFAHRVIYETALWTGYNAYEMIGLLECVKTDLLADLKDFDPDCDGDCDNCDKK